MDPTKTEDTATGAFTEYPIEVTDKTSIEVTDKTSIEVMREALEETYKSFEQKVLVEGEDMGKYAIFPIQNHDLYSFYERQRDMFWVVGEIDFGNDRQMWDMLTSDEQHFITFVLFFFAQADGLVMENLAVNFQEEVKYKEARMFYAMQNAIEAVHNETYSVMIDVVVRDEKMKQMAFNAIKHCPEIRTLAAWISHWTDRKHDLIVRLFAFAIYEGIFFSSAFCAIRWIKRNNVLPGFCQANELISRDEKLHLDFSVCLINKLIAETGASFPRDVMIFMVQSSFDVLSKYIKQALRVELIGMTSEGMIEYTKICYNYLTTAIGFGDLFEAKNPYSWMEEISMHNKTNFFEHKVTEYSKTQSIDDFSFQVLKEGEF
jgi:ribonucleoside-diphosphate reductase beta chain